MSESHESILDRVSIAAPCQADWENMVGDERERFCQQCTLNVYNISSMSKTEAEEFLALRTQGRLCVQFYRRADGTIITDNCPRGLRAMRDRGRKLMKSAAAFLALIVSSTPFAFAQPSSNHPERGKVRVTPATQSESQIQNQTNVEPAPLRGEVYIPPKKDDSGAKNDSACFVESEKTLKDKIAKLESIKSDKINIARAHLDLAAFYRSKNLLESADSEYKIAAEILAKLPKEKALFKNALLNRAAVLKLMGKEKEATQLEKTAGKK